MAVEVGGKIGCRIKSVAMYARGDASIIVGGGSFRRGGRRFHRFSSCSSPYFLPPPSKEKLWRKKLEEGEGEEGKGARLEYSPILGFGVRIVFQLDATTRLLAFFTSCPPSSSSLPAVSRRARNPSPQTERRIPPGSNRGCTLIKPRYRCCMRVI